MARWRVSGPAGIGSVGCGVGEGASPLSALPPCTRAYTHTHTHTHTHTRTHTGRRAHALCQSDTGAASGVQVSFACVFGLFCLCIRAFLSVGWVPFHTLMH